jgi:uncharacterized DUF497 family protein
MIISYVLHDVHFEWDSEKAASNLDKHGVSFETACEAFFDPFVSMVDEQVVEGEVREVIIGMTTQWQLLSVVHTVRNQEIFRIISARRATRFERSIYEEY